MHNKKHFLFNRSVYSIDACVYFVFLLFGFSTISYAQGKWEWVHGDTGTVGIYSPGTVGVPSVNNNPTARYGAANWTDAQGNLWLYGGRSAFTNVMCDMWKFDVNTNMWTRMHAGTTNPVYGTIGVAAPANNPGARQSAPATWVDNNGILWLFGGDNWLVQCKGDLWKYDPGTNLWTWVKGPTGNYQLTNAGTQFVWSTTNEPGSKCHIGAGVVDANGDLILYGGRSENGKNFQNIWKYNIASNQWVWVYGPVAYPVQNANYGTKTISSAANKPAPDQEFYSLWLDAQNNMWLYDPSLRRNVVWKYDFVTNEWTWMNGQHVVQNHRGNYGTLCAGDTANFPPSRERTSTKWKDECGNFYIYSGATRNPNYGPSATNAFTNDLWRYNPIRNDWTYVWGDINFTGPVVYGQKNVPSATNKPPDMVGGASWKSRNSFYVYGLTQGGVTWGYLNVQKNVLWRFVPDAPIAAFTSNAPVTTCAMPVVITYTNASDANCLEMKSYSWDFGDPSSGAMNVSTLENPTHTYAAPGTYSVQLIVENCMGIKDTAINPIQITLGTSTVSINSTAPSVCSGSGATLSASASNTYLWSPGGATTASLTVSPVSTTSYTVVATDNYNCTAQAIFTLSVNSKPTVSIAAPSAVCNGQSVTLSANGASTYLWSLGGATTVAITNAPTTTTMYSVLGTDNVGCSAQAIFTLSVNSTPTVSIAAPSAVCNGQSVTLSASGASAYLWSLGGATTAAVTDMPTSTTTYSVLGTDNVGCSAQAVITVTVNFLPVLQLIGNTSICNGVSTTLTAAGANSYSWLPVVGLNNASVPVVVVTTTATTTYTVVGVDINACADTAFVTVNVSDTPTAQFTANNQLSCSSGCITFLNTSLVVANTTNTYTWNFGDGNTSSLEIPLNCYQASGLYSVTLYALNNAGCADTVVASNYITILDSPFAAFSTNPVSNANVLEEILFLNNSANATNYWWNFGDGQNDTLVSPTHVYSEGGSYTIQLIASNGSVCSDTAYTQISVEDDFTLFVPNSFSPDGDGLNDVFRIYSTNQNISNFRITLFNRWGEVIWETEDIQTGWDGKYLGAPDVAQQEVYVYLIQLKDTNGIKRKYTGNISLIR